MAGKDIEILLKARDDASAKIKALEDHLRKLNAHNKKFAQDAAPALALGKVFAAMGAVEGAARGVSAVTAAFRGDFQSAAEEIKRLPFGIGAAASALEGVLDILTRTSEQIEENNALAKKQNEIAEKRLTVLQRVKAARLEDEAESATGFERERLKLLIREKNTLDEIAKLRQEASPISGSSVDRQLTELEELARSGTARAMQEAWAKARQEQNRAFEAQERERLAAEQKLQKERDEAFRNQQSILDLDAEIAAARLRLMGEDEAAEIESINRRYDARIAAAERANEAEKVARLKTLKELALREAGQRGDSGSSTRAGDLVGLTSRFLGRAPGFNDPSLDAQKQTAKNSKALPQIAQKIDHLIKATTSRAGLTVREGIGI
jgi:hypothetical protein